MNRPSARHELPRAQQWAERAFATIERLLHIEALGGAALLVAALTALAWANSPLAQAYHHFWHLPVSLGVGPYVSSQSLHFWINDGLMTVFFLVVGMEIRREIHAGALSSLQQAALPMAAALGGVAVPALIYLALNPDPTHQHGWAVPTATDIAFAVGILALLGRSIPANVRVFLLALAIIDDIVAVLIIALFYSGGLQPMGLVVAAGGVLMVRAFQKLGIGSAFAYVVPGAVLWAGLLVAGVHPTLAGVVLGFMTPVLARPARENPLQAASRALQELPGRGADRGTHGGGLQQPLRDLRIAQRDMLAPVVRVQRALHPWVAFGIMPLFALANAGVSLEGAHVLADTASAGVVAGIALALALGKPLGVVGMSWLMVRLGWCRLPPGVSWGGIVLVGLLAGVGFTMSIFIAMLAFADPGLLGAAKLGVLLGSFAAAVLGLAWGALAVRQRSP